MYDYEYENDVLLFLRLLKFLHTEHPFVLEQIIKDYPTADEEDIWMILDELLMAVFDEGAPDEGDDMMTVRFPMSGSTASTRRAVSIVKYCPIRSTHGRKRSRMSFSSMWRGLPIPSLIFVIISPVTV